MARFCCCGGGCSRGWMPFFRLREQRARGRATTSVDGQAVHQQLGRQMEDEENIFDRCMAEVLADEHPSDKHRRLKSLEIIDGVARTAESSDNSYTAWREEEALPTTNNTELAHMDLWGSPFVPATPPSPVEPLPPIESRAAGYQLQPHNETQRLMRENQRMVQDFFFAMQQQQLLHQFQELQRAQELNRAMQRVEALEQHAAWRERQHQVQVAVMRHERASAQPVERALVSSSLQATPPMTPRAEALRPTPPPSRPRLAISRFERHREQQEQKLVRSRLDTPRSAREPLQRPMSSSTNADVTGPTMAATSSAREPPPARERVVVEQPPQQQPQQQQPQLEPLLLCHRGRSHLHHPCCRRCVRSCRPSCALVATRTRERWRPQTSSASHYWRRAARCSE